MIHATVNGISFASLGLGLTKYNIPVLPDTRDYGVEIAGKDGEIDFGSVYSSRTFTLECVLMADDSSFDYHQKIATIASVFNAKKGDLDLYFSDRQGRRYMARYAGSMPIEKLIFDGMVSIPLKMHNPYPESQQDTSAKEYGQGLEYGQGYEYATSSVQVTKSSQSIPIQHDGTAEVAPFIRITGNFTNLSLSDGTNTFTFTGTTTGTDVIEIDCKKFTVKKNGVNAYGSTNGVFFLLKPGTTTFIANSTNPNFKIEFIFRHTYLY
ncbi:phage tail domain-containing protein [Paenibacillus thermotolerans]|uniref:phage tail domain-containing protein n=1 Tax=Paenibacillus thermotolerans TaxID=3027807 RepID=UPI00236879CE|nr:MULTISPECIES: phage tail domain-containing protein [unclassified Paenibacillus]